MNFGAVKRTVELMSLPQGEAGRTGMDSLPAALGINRALGRWRVT
jgi:hypothetical protein